MTTSHRQYWLWVTRPEFYLDEDKNEREDLDPSISPDAEHWWTCHKDTQSGDLALLYRTEPKYDIAYLLQITSDAIVIEQEYQEEYGWSYRCDCQVLYKVRQPLTIQDMREDPYLDDWNALEAGSNGQHGPLITRFGAS